MQMATGRSVALYKNTSGKHSQVICSQLHGHRYVRTTLLFKKILTLEGTCDCETLCDWRDFESRPGNRQEHVKLLCFATRAVRGEGPISCRCARRVVVPS